MRVTASDAISASVSPLGLKDMPMDVSRHGRDRPVPPPASSTNPYFASWRRWNEQVVADSPIRSPTWVAVIAPPSASSSNSAIRTGWASARRVRAAVIFRICGSSGALSGGGGVIAASSLDMSRY